MLSCEEVEAVIPLLVPGDGELLPALQRLLTGKWGDSFVLVEVLYRLGRKEEAVEQAARTLEGYWTIAEPRPPAGWASEAGRPRPRSRRCADFWSMRTASGQARAERLLRFGGRTGMRPGPCSCRPA